MANSPMAVRLSDPLKERIRTLATHRQRPVHWLMCEAIEQYVTREEQRELSRQEALAAWREYQETGLHVTGDEMISWLETWGEANEKSAPECHK